MHWKRKDREPAAAAMYERLVEAGDECCDDERVVKGCFPVLVGSEEGSTERFVVPVRQLKDPRIASLLDMAAQEFGYRQQGILRLSCDADHFRRVIKKSKY